MRKKKRPIRRVSNASGSNAGFKAGVWRWKVKTLSDPDARQVDLTQHHPMTLQQIDSLPKQNLTLADRDRPRGVTIQEFRVIEVNGSLRKLKLEGDGDYHMVLESQDGQSGVNCELPKPEFAAGSVGLPEISAMRKLVESRIGKGDKPGTIVPLPNPLPNVVVQGVGFWDMQHGQDGGDLNGFELHPVLRVEIKP